MLTGDATAVNSQPARSGHWLSVTKLAEERGISKPAVTQALKRWASAGVVVSTQREGRELLVNVAEFDVARGEHGDLGRQQGEQTKKGAGNESGDPIFAREQARRAAYDADLAQIKRDEALGRLVPIADLEMAAISCAEAVVRLDDSIVNSAEEIAEAVAKNGVIGARTALKEIARKLRQAHADELTKIAAAKPLALAEQETEPA